MATSNGVTIIISPHHDHRESHADEHEHRDSGNADPSTTANTTPEAMDRQEQQQHHHAVLFTPVVLSILVTETAERFAYFGFRAVLVLYFTTELWLSESTSISLFAYTTCLANFMPLVGAALADSYWGRFGTILRFGGLYAVGLAVLTYGALVDHQLRTASALGDVVLGGNDQSLEEEVTFVEVDESKLFWQRALTCGGLVLICVGTGGIKPCVNIFGADQVALRDNNHSATTKTKTTQEKEEQEHAVREFFNFFYFCINVGAVGSFAVIPIVKRHFGFGAAFFLPTCFMCFALVLFYSKRHDYVYRDHVSSPPVGTATDHRENSHDLDELLGDKDNNITLDNGSEQQKVSEEESPSSILTIFRLCGFLLIQKFREKRKRLLHLHSAVPQEDMEDGTCIFQDEPNNVTHTAQLHRVVQHQSTSYTSQLPQPVLPHSPQEMDDAQQAMKILPIMAVLPMFWMLYDQQGSVWTLQASRMALHGLEPEQLNVLNPLEIMLFIPLFDRVFYPALERRHWNLAPLTRMGWGMILAALSFVVSAFLEHAIERDPITAMDDDGSGISIYWQIPQITILAVAEIFLSVTGLEYSYSMAPDRLKGFIMATFLLTTSLGDLLGGLLYASVFRDMDRAAAMYACAVLMLLNRFVFGCVVVATQPHQDHDSEHPGSLQQELQTCNHHQGGAVATANGKELAILHGNDNLSEVQNVRKRASIKDSSSSHNEEDGGWTV